MSPLALAAVFLAAGIGLAAGPVRAGTDLPLPFTAVGPDGLAAGKATGRRHVTFAMPDTSGLPVKAARIDVVFDAGSHAWNDAVLDGKDVAIAQDGKAIARVPLQSSRFAYSQPLPVVPPAGSRLSAQVASMVGACTALEDVMGSMDLRSSRLVLTLDDERPLHLPAIEPLLAAMIAPDQPLRIYSPHGLRSDLELTTAALLTQGWTLRSGERPANVESVPLPRARGESHRLLPGVDTAALNTPVGFLVGTQAALQDYVSEELLGQVSGPFVSLVQIPGPDFRAVILVSGRTDREVLTAARALGGDWFSWPDASAVVLRTEEGSPAEDGASAQGTAAAIPLPPVLWGADSADGAAKTSSFESMGIATESFSGTLIPDATVRLVVSDPPPASAPVKVALSYAYGPGLSADSAWSVTINGKFVAAVAANSPAGGTTAGQEVAVPAAMLAPGINRIELHPRLKPASAEGCAPIKDDGFASTLFADSHIETPWLGGLKRQPSLANWAATGLLIPEAGYRPTAWIVANPSDETVSAALTLFSRVVRTVGQPLTNSLITTGWHVPYKNRVIVGTTEDTTNLLKGRPQTHLGGAPPIPPQGDSIDAFVDRFLGVSQDSIDTLLNHAVAMRTRIGADGRTAALIGLADAESNATVVLSAEDPESLFRSALSLAETRHWESLNGDVALVVPGYDEALGEAVLPPAKDMRLPRDILGQAKLFIEEAGAAAPWKWIALCLGLLVLFALFTKSALRTRRARDAEE